MENFPSSCSSLNGGTDMLSALGDIRNNLAQAALSLPVKRQARWLHGSTPIPCLSCWWQ